MAHATRVGDWIVVDVGWNESEIVKLVPGTRYSKIETGEKVWHLPLTWASMVALRGVFGQHFTYSQDLVDWTTWVRRYRVDPALAVREVLSWPEEGFDPRLYPFQRADVTFMDVSGSWLLGNEAGTGKTISALEWLRRLGPDALPALIVCPNSVKHHWRKRAAEYYPSVHVYVVEKGAVKGRKLIAEAHQDPKALVVVNFEGVRSYSRSAPYGNVKLKRCRACDPKYGDEIPVTRCEVHQKELNAFGFKTVIIDEIHTIGNAKAKWTRASWAVMHDPSVTRRGGMTGTPDNMTRLWNIMHAIAPDEYPVKSTWMDRYALQAWNAFGGMDVVGIRPDTRDEFYKIFDPRFRRMIKAVVLPQLPPKVRVARYAELPTAQRRMYDELDNQLHTRLEDGSIFIAQNKIVSRTRLMQFAAGTIKVEKPDEDDVSTWQVSITDPSAKLDVMEEVIDEFDLEHKPFVVAAVNRDVVFMAAARLAKRKIRHGIIVGGMQGEEQEQLTEDLRTGKLQALVYTVASGSTGLDMSGAGTQINLQRSWSLIQNLQNEERCLRPGAERHDVLNVVDIITSNSVEEGQVEKLLDKLRRLDEITRDKSQLARRLAELPDRNDEYVEISSKIESLQVEERRVLANDDIDEFLSMEEA